MQAIINVLNLLEETSVPFHAQDDLLNSSTRISQVPNFRQEIRQSHYRNDPVKYDLDGESKPNMDILY